MNEQRIGSIPKDLSGSSADRIIDREGQKLDGVDPIEEGAGIIFRHRDDVGKFVETPLLPAVLELFDKNIRTLWSTANHKDLLTGEVGFGIDFNSLSLENRITAVKLGEIVVFAEKPAVSIKIPVNQDTPVGQIESVAEEIIQAFITQPLRWGVYTREEMLWRNFTNPDEVSILSNEEMVASLNSGVLEYYYDPVTQLFFQSEELFDKFKQSQNLSH